MVAVEVWVGGQQNHLDGANGASVRMASRAPSDGYADPNLLCCAS
jgi:hypothetical protein